jgi:multiple sugar transport system permease protein
MTPADASDLKQARVQASARLASISPGRGVMRGPAPWLIPALLMIGLFYFVPILDALRLAFTDASLLEGELTYSLDAITAVVNEPALGIVLRNTAIFAVCAVAGQTLAGLGIALLVARGERHELRGMLALRTIVLIAWVVPGVASGLIWQMLLSEAPFGAVNSALRLIGIAPVAWLSNPSIAMVSIVLATVWQGTAFSMIVLYAARKTADESLYEAASVDGATPFEKFIHITLPQMRAALLVNAILVTIQMLNAFDAIIALTGGGPGRATEVLSLFTYRTVFSNHDLARGSVLAMLLLAISLVLAFVYALFLPKQADAA